MITKMNIRNGFEYLCIYLTLLFKSGFYFVGNSSFMTSIILLLLLLTSCLIYNERLNKKVTYVGLILVTLYIATELVTGVDLFIANMNVHILFLVNVITSILLVSFIDYKNFKEKFCNTIWLICIVSIIGWFIMKYIPSFASIFPTLVNEVETKGYFLLLAVLVDYSFTGAIRAQGIFWEPGAFQTMIIIAMSMEFFSGIEKKRWKHYVIYVLAGMLTFSTTGIFCIALMSAIYMCKKKNSFFKLLLLLIGLVVLYGYLKENTTGFFYYTLFRKLEGIFDYQVGVSSDASSRIDSIILPMWAFFKSPILGVGLAGYSNFADIVGHTMFTCTPINYFAKYGLFFATICFWGYWKLIYKKSIPFWKIIFLVVVLLLSVSTEEFTL